MCCFCCARCFCGCVLSSFLGQPPQPHTHRQRSWGHDDTATPSNRNWRDADPPRFGAPRVWQEETDHWGSSGRDGDRWERRGTGGPGGPGRYNEPQHNGYGAGHHHGSGHHHHHHGHAYGSGGSALLVQDDPLLDDVALFPPGPSGRRPSGGESGGEGHHEARNNGGGVVEEEDDPERAAFEHELEQLASQLHKVGCVV